MFITIAIAMIHIVSYVAATTLMHLYGASIPDDHHAALEQLKASAVLYAYQQAEKASILYACQPVEHWETLLQATLESVLELAQNPVLLVLVVVASIVAACIRYGLSMYSLRTQQTGTADKTRNWLAGVSGVSIQVLTRTASLVADRCDWWQLHRDHLMERLLDALETVLSSLL